MSGKQRIPQLRIEFIDQREGQVSDGGVAEVKELLTEAVTLEIASVLPEGQSLAELRPARPKLPLEIGPGPLARYGPWVALGLLVLALGVWLPILRRRAEARIRITAFDAALERLRVLEASGLPDPEAADDWYVELSQIVRRYLEDRYGVRAPELTTEEFLREAQRSHTLEDRHRGLVSSFLERCDRVKFAAHHPEREESKEVISVARKFLEDTRLEEQPEQQSAAAA